MRVADGQVMALLSAAGPGDALSSTIAQGCKVRQVSQAGFDARWYYVPSLHWLVELELIMLEALHGIMADLLYCKWRYPGAMCHPYAQDAAVNALRVADEHINKVTSGHGRLLVWDVYRTLECQTYIFEKEHRRIARENPHLSEEQVRQRVTQLVSPPSIDSPAPHTTGGAADVTILFDADSVKLGTFDDFSEYGNPSYFEQNAPRTPEQEAAHELRQLLNTAMLKAGFVGISTEWWHFEFGTIHWARQKNSPVKFKQLVPPPPLRSLGTWRPSIPIRQPVFATGVAQVFTTTAERAAALSGEIDGHYYARRRHPTERQLATLHSTQLGCDNFVYVQSGLAASILAILAHVPPGGAVAIDELSYYETAESVEKLARERHWRVYFVHLCRDELEKCGRVDAILTENPRNWLLTSPDLHELRRAADDMGSVLIVDTSVQPLQYLRGIADVVVLSLSKYPSAGLTLGGAIGYFDKKLHSLCEATAGMYGAALAPEAALTILTQSHTLPDRLAALTVKAKSVADFLRSHIAVNDVFFPDAERTGGLEGAQVSFRAISGEVAKRAEILVTNNALDPDFCLSLACTFGSLMTTFEHFGSRD